MLRLVSSCCVPAVVERLWRRGEVETPSADERQREENESRLEVGWVAGNVWGKSMCPFGLLRRLFTTPVLLMVYNFRLLKKELLILPN